MPSENWKEESTQINEIVDSFGVPLALEIEVKESRLWTSDRVKESKSQSRRDLPFAIAAPAEVGTKAQLDQP